MCISIVLDYTFMGQDINAFWLLQNLGCLAIQEKKKTLILPGVQTILFSDGTSTLSQSRIFAVSTVHG